MSKRSSIVAENLNPSLTPSTGCKSVSGSIQDSVKDDGRGAPKNVARLASMAPTRSRTVTKGRDETILWNIDHLARDKARSSSLARYTVATDVWNRARIVMWRAPRHAQSRSGAPVTRCR